MTRPFHEGPNDISPRAGLAFGAGEDTGGSGIGAGEVDSDPKGRALDRVRGCRLRRMAPPPREAPPSKMA